MVDTFTMKLLMKAAPNYHGLSARFLNGSYAACPCRACVSSAVIGGHRICLRVLNAGAKRGYAFVDETATCDKELAEYCVASLKGDVVQAREELLDCFAVLMREWERITAK